jgi:hypothetical protein
MMPVDHEQASKQQDYETTGGAKGFAAGSAFCSPGQSRAQAKDVDSGFAVSQAGDSFWSAHKPAGG